MKFLIIKTGEFETFDQEERLPVVSLGDVLRSTVLTHVFKDAEWFTSLESERLLAGQKLTRTISPRNYDWVLNLENNEKYFKELGPNTLGFVDKNRLKLFGGEEITLSEFLSMYSHLNWAQKLFKLIGQEWNGERPVLFSLERDKCFDVGLNWKVGPKWPAKDWGKAHWQSVHQLLSEKCSVSWQQGFTDLEIYIDWIKSVKVLLTHDSLGLHIAQALHIPVVALFGPTSSKEIPLYDEDIFLNFHQDPHLTSARIDEILKQVLLRSENESSARRK
ncbi:MAG: glycosyltransferase family 9 protein [Bacteriovoracaceae bacterium]